MEGKGRGEGVGDILRPLGHLADTLDHQTWGYAQRELGEYRRVLAAPFENLVILLNCGFDHDSYQGTRLLSPSTRQADFHRTFSSTKLSSRLGIFP